MQHPKLLALGALGVLVAAAVLLLARNGLDVVTVSADSTTGPAITPAVPSAAKERKPLAYYVKDLRPTVFRAPGRDEAISAPLPSSGAAGQSSGTSAARMNAASNADSPRYILTGVATLHGRKTALIENTVTRQGSFVHIGDLFQGGKVVGIDSRGVTLRRQGERRHIDRFEGYRLTPLNASAPYLTAPTQPATTAPAPATPSVVVQIVAPSSGYTAESWMPPPVAAQPVQVVPQPVPVPVAVPDSIVPPTSYPGFIPVNPEQRDGWMIYSPR